MPAVFTDILLIGLSLPLPVAPDAVKIESTVRGRQITWRVTNVSGPPITKVDIPAHHVYDHHGPSGWECKESDDAMCAAARESVRAITSGQSGEFSVCGTSSGTVVADGFVRVTFDTGETIELPGALTFDPERTGTTLLVPAVILVMVGVYVLSSRRRRPAD